MFFLVSLGRAWHSSNVNFPRSFHCFGIRCNFFVIEVSSPYFAAFSRGYRKKEGLGLEFSKMKGLLVKKAIHFWRNRTITLVQLLLPVLFTIVALAVDQARPQTLTEPALSFNLGPFQDSTVAYSNGSR